MSSSKTHKIHKMMKYMNHLCDRGYIIDNNWKAPHVCCLYHWRGVTCKNCLKHKKVRK